MIPNINEHERRGFERIPWECHARLLPLSLEPTLPTLGLHHGLGRDISEGGLQVWSNRLFPVKSRLLLEMEAPEIPEGIQAVGSVVWISPTTSQDQWCLGIEFSDVGESARARIRDLLQPEPTYN